MPSLLHPDWGPYIPADHPALRWEGRVRFNPQRSAIYDWASVRAHLDFEGRTVAIYGRLGANYLDVLVDGRRVAVLGKAPRGVQTAWASLLVEPQFSGGKAVYVVKDLPPGRHHLVLAKRSGPNFGTVTLQGMRLTRDATLLSPLAAPKRRIEVVGDSLSVGYGVEGPGVHCKQLAPFENSSLAWARQAAEILGADAQVLAYSGNGLLRNYGAKTRRSPRPMPYFYPRTVFDEDTVWERSAFKPDLAVVFLGDNDYNTQPGPESADFIAAYHAFLEVVRQGRPSLPILCAYVSDRSGLAQRVKSVVAEEQAKGRLVQALALPAVADVNLGCDSHPNGVAQTQWSKAAAQAIGKMLGW